MDLTLVVVVCLSSFALDCPKSLPYTLVSMLGRERERGKLMGVLNVFVVLPSFVVLSLVGVTNMRSNEILNVGAAISAAATLACIAIPIHPTIQ